MIKLHSIQFEGFKCFRERQKLAIGNDPALCFLTGDNQVDAIDANGVGKSTVWDALTWCLFGRMVNGASGRAPDCDYPESAPAKVTVRLSVHGKAYAIRRSRKPNRVMMGVAGARLRTTTDQGVLDVLGVSFTQFSAIAVIGQLSQSFLDLTPKGQLDILDGIIDLSVWDRAIDACRQRIGNIDTRTARARDRIRSSRDALKEARRRLKNQRNLLRTMQQTDTSRLRKLLRSCKKLERKRDGIQAKLNTVGSDLKRLSDNVDDGAHKLAALDRDINNHRRSLDKLNHDLKASKQASKELKGRLLSLRHSTCPLCGSKVGGLHGEDLYERTQYSLGFSRTETKHIKAKRVKVIATLRTAKDARLQLSAELDGRDSELQKLRRGSATLRAELTSCLRDIESTRDDVQQLVGASPAILQCRREIRRIKSHDVRKTLDSIKQTKAKVLRMQNRRKSLAFWQKEFKLVQLQVIDTALNIMTQASRSALHQLGLRNWDVRFTTERAGTSGTVSRLSTLVKPEGRREYSTHNSWSGGEGQRLKIAVSCGLMELAAVVADFKMNIEVWDEPTAHLSAGGVAALVELLSDRAQTLNKQVWLVDHRTISFAFDRTVRVIKTADGSVLETD